MSDRATTQRKPIYTLDLDFQKTPGTIASYLIPYANGAVLVESGPGSTIPALQAALHKHGFEVQDVSDVLLTHIHLDHAGAAGWLARQGARIHVHPVGAPHLLDPKKLLSSAERIYGDTMDTLWGEFLSVPENRLSVIQDGDVLEIDGLRFKAIDTPGHAYHHHAYLFEDVLFTGDIGGVRLQGPPHLRLPMPPPEFHLEKWRESLQRLRQEEFKRIAPTHFGIFNDPEWHLAALERALKEVEDWMQTELPADPPFEKLNEDFLSWTRKRTEREGVSEDLIRDYEVANPSWMSTYGIQRYWKKYRAEGVQEPSHGS